MVDYVKQRNWYTCFDPVGSMGNVHLLLPKHTEYNAGYKAQVFADKMGAPHVTMKLIHPRKK